MSSPLPRPIPPGFRRHRRRAERKAASPASVREITRKAYLKLERLRPHFRALRRDLPVLIRLLRAWSTGSYRRIPWKAVVSALAAVLYFLNPFDVIPDFIPLIGYLDDAAVAAYVMSLIGDEVDRYRAWEST
jgi:uncharacterized membrane protein YkvA (DUF1232 family)